MNEILIPVISFGGIGLVLGLLLGFASKVFLVETDPLVDEITVLLPGANCGGCGYTGCAALAQAIAGKKVSASACPSAADENTQKIAKLMGVEVKKRVPVAALVKCSGKIDKASYKYFFEGTKSCYSVNRLAGGDKNCSYACLGYGDCVGACVFDAIRLEDGIAIVDREKCTSCGMCAKVCPRGVAKLLPKAAPVIVACSSCDKGRDMREKCTAGCIACGICVKNCPEGAIVLDNNLAKIDHEKCTGCLTCVEKCPKKVILSSHGVS